jgi:hypothetical protein
MPAKLKKLNAVTGIVASIFDAQGNLAQSVEDQIQLIGSRQWFTPSGYDAIVHGGRIVLSKLSQPGLHPDEDVPTNISAPVEWRGVVNYIGELVNGVSLMAFVNESNGNTVVGTVSYDPTDPYSLLFDVDPATIPSNSLQPVISIIDPQRVGPGSGLPAAAAGQRYLVIDNAIGNPTNNPSNHPSAWRNADSTPFYAQVNDIIEYDGSSWSVSFAAAEVTAIEYVTNTYSGVQLRWADGRWQKSWEGLYKEGLFLIAI